LINPLTIWKIWWWHRFTYALTWLLLTCTTHVRSDHLTL